MLSVMGSSSAVCRPCSQSASLESRARLAGKPAPEQFHCRRQLSIQQQKRSPFAHSATRIPSSRQFSIVCAKDEEKSWKEIASDIGNVAKAVVKKVASLLPIPKEAEKPAERYDGDWSSRRSRDERPVSPRRDPSQITRRPSEDLEGMGGLANLATGLLGRSLGGLVASAFSGLEAQIREGAQTAADIHALASKAVESDAVVSKRLGGSVRCGSPFSSSTSSMSVNGQSSTRVAIAFNAQGANGGVAVVSVDATLGSRKDARDMKISVRLPQGDTVRVKPGAGAADDIIDVEVL
eukprot:jgi/Mesvir1/22536/Mv18555-RA.1